MPQGLRKPRVRTCYLCKRVEGEKSLNLDEEKEGEVVLSNIELIPFEIRFGGGVTFSYLLCIESALLLDVMEKMEGNSEE